MATVDDDKMAIYMPPKPDHEGLQPAYNIRAGDGLEAPQVALDRSEFKELNAPTMEDRSSRTALVTSATSPDGYGYGARSFRSSTFYASSGPDSDPRSNRYCGEKQPGWGERPWWKRWRVITGLVLLFLIVVTVAVTVPLMMMRNKNQGPSSQPDTGGDTPQSKSTSGTLVGTGVGANDIFDPTIAFFQHYNGDLWETASGGRDFVGKVLDASFLRNGTPLAAIYYFKGGVDQQFYRTVVYLDPNNTLHDIQQVAGSGNWEQGYLGAGQFRASSASTVGLALIGIRSDDTSIPTSPLGSLRVYYGGEDGRLHEIQLHGDDTQWKETFVFPNNINGNAGVHAAQPFGNTTLVCSTNTSELTFWQQRSRDIDPGPWEQRADSGITVTTNSDVGMALDYLVYYQDPKNSLRAVQFNPNITNESAWGPVYFVDNAIPHTHLIGMSVDGDSTPAVIYQNETNNLIQAMGQPVHNATVWNQTVMPVN